MAMRYLSPAQAQEEASPKKSKSKPAAASPEETKAPSRKRRPAKKPVDSPDDAA